MKRLGWGIWGAGAIARDFVLGLESTPSARLVHVAARRLEPALDLAGPRARVSDNLEALLDDDEVEAVYVATPNPFHEWAALSAIARGKSVLVEKPLAPNAAATRRVIEAGVERGVVVAEGYMYRYHPLLAAVAAVAASIRSGAVGRVQHIRADFGFAAERRSDHRLFAPELGGGAVWDLGGYPLTFAQWVAGVALDRPFAHATSMNFAGVVGPTGVEELAVAQLKFEGGISAQLACSIRHDLGTRAQIFGDAGCIELPDPWLPSGQRQGTRTEFFVTSRGAGRVRHDIEARSVFGLEAEAFAALVLSREPSASAVSNAESLATAECLDAWRGSLGV